MNKNVFMYGKDESLNIIVGKTIDQVLINDNSDEVTFVCGLDAFWAYHSQDCCEKVGLEKVVGNLNDIIGSPVTHANCEVLEGNPEGFEDYKHYDSFTWTIHTLTTERGTVKFIWLGESNGYYSESVYFSRTHVPYPR